MFRQRTNAYWKRRAQEQLDLVERQALPHIKEIDRIYRGAQKKNLADVKTLYVNYYAQKGFDVSALQQIAPSGDVRRFQRAVAEVGLSSQLPDAYRYRLTRLELLDAQMWLEIRRVGLAEQALNTLAHRATIETGYYYNLYNISKGTGVAPVFSKIDTRTMDAILRANFMGSNYSDRVWKNTGKLAGEMKGIIGESVATGRSQSRTAKEIRERYGVSRFEARRLIQTETNHFNTEASMEGYREVGIDEWVYLATLDSRTSDECQLHDGKRFPIQAGPMPPRHPLCRCTDRAWLGEEYEPDERIMRDPDTGKNRYIPNMSYQQWRSMYNL